MTTALFTPLPDYKRQSMFLRMFWENPAFAQVRYPITANRDFPPDQVNQLIKSLSQADKDAEWMAVVPTKP